MEWVIFALFSRSILAWRRHIAATFFKHKLPRLEPEPEGDQPKGDAEPEKTEEKTGEKDEDDEDDDIDKDIEEQLLKMNEQQRKEAKRFDSDSFPSGHRLSETFLANVNTS